MIQISIVIPTVNAGEKLNATINSILYQQSAPNFEIIVVSNFPNTALEQNLLSWDKRLRYLCSGEIGTNTARNLGLENAKGEIVLFLDDDVWIEDRLFLKKHLDAHQRMPEAIGVGGPYTLKRNANMFETAYHWILNTQFANAKLNEDFASHLPGGNSSFKTLALKSAFRFNPEIDFGGTAQELHLRLFAAGHQLHFSERISVEHRPQIGLVGFVSRAYMQGRSEKVRELSWIASNWRFNGAAQTRARQIAEHDGVVDENIQFAFWLYDLAFNTAKARTVKARYQRNISTTQILKNVVLECVKRAKAIPSSPNFMELFQTLRFSIFGR